MADPKTLDPVRWLVWSNEHRAWWGPECRGYFTGINSAGRYTLAKALECAENRSRDGDVPPEVVVPAPESIDLLLSVDLCDRHGTAYSLVPLGTILNEAEREAVGALLKSMRDRPPLAELIVEASQQAVADAEPQA